MNSTEDQVELMLPRRLTFAVLPNGPYSYQTYCLELGISSHGVTFDEADDSLRSLVRSHIQKHNYAPPCRMAAFDLDAPPLTFADGREIPVRDIVTY